jgi:hypothetical protein
MYELTRPDKRILQAAAMTALHEPSTKDLTNLQMFLHTPDMDAGAAFHGPDKDTWGSLKQSANRAEDLISLVRSPKEDSFSRWFLDSVMTRFFAFGLHRWRKRDEVTNELYYERDKVLRITYYITTGLSTILLVVSVVILWLVTSMGARLAIIAAFNIALSMCIAVFTMAERAQVFAVVAGFVNA